MLLNIPRRKIFGETQHHDIAKAETGHTYFEDAVAVENGFLLLGGIFKVNVGLISHKGEQFHHFPKRYFLRVENHKYFLALEVCLRFDDARVNAVQVLEQENAGGAVHLRQRKSNVGLRIAAELDEFLCRGGIIEVSEAVGIKFAFYFNAGVLVEVIISTEVILVQQQVNLFASLAAKRVPVCLDFLLAGVATMVAGGLYGLIYFDKITVLKNEPPHKTMQWLN